MTPEEYLIELSQPETELDIPPEDVAVLQALTSSSPAMTDEEGLSPIQTPEGEVEVTEDDLINQLLASPSQQNPTDLVNSVVENRRPQSIVIGTQDPNQTRTTISIGEDGRKVISVVGSSEEFQGMGKYTTPAEFMRVDPEGFKRVNPLMWQRMERERQAAQQAPTQMSAQIMGELDAKMQAITQEKDPVKRQLMLSDLQVSAAQAGANLAREMRMSATRQANLEGLKAQILENEKLDRSDPLYMKMGGKDSPQTAALKKQYAQAEKSIGTLTKQMITENPTIAAMGVKLKNFVAMQGRMTEKELAGAEKRQDLIEQTTAAITPTEVKRLSFLYPQVAGDEKKAAEALIGLTGKEQKAKLGMWMEVSKAETDAELLPIALKGNPMAREILTKSQMEKTGQSYAEVSKDMERFQGILGNEAVFMKATDELIKAGVPRMKEVKKAYSMALLDKSKEAQGTRMNLRLEVASQHAKVFRENILLNDVESWNGNINIKSNPQIAQTIDLIKTTNGGKPVSLRSLVDRYVSVAPKEERANRLAQIQTAFDSTLSKYDQALFGAVDKAAMRTQLQAMISFSNVLSMKDFGANVRETMTDPNTYQSELASMSRNAWASLNQMGQGMYDFGAGLVGGRE